MNSCELSTASCLKMKVFRLAREAYARELTGLGASLRGGRWNSRGVRVQYAAEDRALALAEVAVHLTWAMLPQDYRMVTLHISDDVAVATLGESDLPSDWRAFPHPATTQRIGDALRLRSEHAVLRVPSAVVAGAFNVLIPSSVLDRHLVEVVSVEPFP